VPRSYADLMIMMRIAVNSRRTLRMSMYIAGVCVRARIVRIADIRRGRRIGLRFITGETHCLLNSITVVVVGNGNTVHLSGGAQHRICNGIHMVGCL
jgi:hypothetical protein